MSHQIDNSYAAAAAIAQNALPGGQTVAREANPSVEVSDAVPGRTLSELQAKFRKPVSCQSAVIGLSPEAGTHLVKLAQGSSKAGPRETVVLVSGGAVVARQG